MSEALRPLVEAAKAGDRRALEELAGCVDRFARIFRGSLSGHLRKVQGSTVDFVLEGLAEAFADLGSFKYQSDEQFYAWISRTIRSRMVDAWRHERRQKRAGRPVSMQEGNLDPPAGDPTASALVSDEELRAAVGKAILELQLSHAKEMEVVVLRVFEGRSWSFIRELQDLASDTPARTLFARGIELLSPRIQKALGTKKLDETLGI